MEKIKVLFVCMGNICRSPTAEGVFRHLIEDMNVADRFVVDSAGTHAYHVGEPADPRAQQVAGRRGIDLSAIRARKVAPADFEEFDYILAMDSDNYHLLMTSCPPAHQHKVGLLLDYATELNETDVPDPYYGGPNGFEYVFDLVEEAAKSFIQQALK